MIAAAGCGGGGAGSTTVQASTAPGTSTRTGVDAALAKTVHDDVDSFTQALDQVTATCPVPKVTLQTMKECKASMQALIQVDNTALSQLDTLDVPAQLQPAVDSLRVSLLTLNAVQKEIIRKFIDKGDVSGFENAGGLGSPIDNAINATKAAFAQLQLLASSGG